MIQQWETRRTLQIYHVKTLDDLLGIERRTRENEEQKITSQEQYHRASLSSDQLSYEVVGSDVTSIHSDSNRASEISDKHSEPDSEILAKISQKYLNLKIEDYTSSVSNSSLPEVNLNVINQSVMLEPDLRSGNISEKSIREACDGLPEYLINSAIHEQVDSTPEVINEHTINCEADFQERHNIINSQVRSADLENTARNNESLNLKKTEIESASVKFSGFKRIKTQDECEFLNGMKNNEWQLKFTINKIDVIDPVNQLLQIKVIFERECNQFREELTEFYTMEHILDSSQISANISRF